MSEKNRVKVVIDEEVYVLSSVSDEDHIQAVARYIDKKIKEIYSVKSEAAINTRLRTLFISLNIADELFKERDKVANAEKEIDRLNRVIDEDLKTIADLEAGNELLEARLSDMQDELTRTRNEMEEYIEVFEINNAMKKGKVTKLSR